MPHPTHCWQPSAWPTRPPATDYTPFAAKFTPSGIAPPSLPPLPARCQEESKLPTGLQADLGYLLHSFLRRYGLHFDMASTYVSVKEPGGGLLQRQGHEGSRDRITCLDPLTGEVGQAYVIMICICMRAEADKGDGAVVG